MENLLLKQLREALPQGMRLPSELEVLYAWIEANGFYDDVGGRRRGYLYPQDRLQQSWSDDEREGGTDIVFFTDEPKNRDEELRYWFYGEDRELAAEIKQRLCVFAGSGSEGSMCALWLDDTGETKIVHMGSGSGSTMTCVLTRNGLDFLRLLAIGYDEICWSEAFSSPPNSDEDELFVHPNEPFKQWVRERFKTTIPQTALEIATPADMDDDEPRDEFLIWIRSLWE
nr:SMI1/KNR4 family protein [uncultured Campylobacter sp.]